MHDEFLMGDSVGLKRTGDPMRELGRGLLFRFGERTGDSVLIKSASRLVNFFGLLDTTKSAFNRFMCTVGAHKILCSKYYARTSYTNYDSSWSRRCSRGRYFWL